MQCRRPAGATGSFFDATIPDTLDITVQLNTNITNEISDARVVTAVVGDADDLIGYQEGGIVLDAHSLTQGTFAEDDDLPIANFGDGELTEDGTTIEWTKIATTGLNFENPTDVGFNLVISGIRANASMVGAGEDIMANVTVGGTVVNSAPLKVADVTEGLVVKAGVAEGLQCADDDAMSTITIQEGFSDAIMSMAPDLQLTGDDLAASKNTARANSDSLLVTFTGIPKV